MAQNETTILVEEKFDRCKFLFLLKKVGEKNDERKFQLQKIVKKIWFLWKKILIE